MNGKCQSHIPQTYQWHHEEEALNRDSQKYKGKLKKAFFSSARGMLNWKGQEEPNRKHGQSTKPPT